MNVNDNVYYCNNCLKKDINIYESYYKSIFSTNQNRSENYKGILLNSGENCKCPICGENMINTNISSMKFSDIAKYCNGDYEYVMAMIKLRNENIIEFTNQMNIIEEKLQKKINAWAKEQLGQTEEPDINKVHCPKCGSTQITTGQTFKRALFGLLYNQVTVNRCANCGCTWEPGK